METAQKGTDYGWWNETRKPRELWFLKKNYLNTIKEPNNSQSIWTQHSFHRIIVVIKIKLGCGKIWFLYERAGKISDVFTVGIYNVVSLMEFTQLGRSHELCAPVGDEQPTVDGGTCAFPETIDKDQWETMQTDLKSNYCQMLNFWDPVTTWDWTWKISCVFSSKTRLLKIRMYTRSCVIKSKLCEMTAYDL